MSDFLCIGDHICLYCEETEGYVYNSTTSSVHNSLFVYQWQDREKPGNITNPHAVTFKICIQNRYKLNKKYRRVVPNPHEELIHKENEDLSPEALEARTLAQQAKMSAQAEDEDNIAEQKRQHTKRVRYGEVIQLMHVFTNKFVHVSTTQTSRRDKNNMLVHMQTYNAKHAQFKILPRYKVKSEGEFVQIFDQIIFESVKSPGQFFHASSAWKIDHFNLGSELNLGIQPAGFTVIKHTRQTEERKHLLKGGCPIRMFHKELEAYVVAEGLFDEKLTEDVHLRIREVDQLIPRSLYPSTSANTYWQVESEASVLSGDVIRWEQQIRFRHMTTRHYLCITADRKVTLTPDCKDPRTVFRLHPVIKEADEVQFNSYARIEHVITGYWLHALREENYVRKEVQESMEERGDSMKGLKWDGADLRKISASGEKMYHDAYTLQNVEDEHVTTLNFVAGMVPFLLNLIMDRQEGKILNAKKAHKICTALDEIRQFMIVNGVATKERQKLMRNLRVIDLLVKLLQFPLEGSIDVIHLTKVFKTAYIVLYTYMVGDSRKNSLYFAKYIDFFNTQIKVTIGDIGLNVAQMIVELIRDNRKIVDRITQEQIEMFVGLLKKNKNYRYLDLLNVLCVCDGVAIADNQTYVTEHWLRRDKENNARFLTERGQNVNGQPNIIYVSTDNASTWMPLHEFVDKENNIAFNAEDVKFFEHQLDLFGKLSYGRNDFAIFVITRELGILTWDEAFLSLRSTMLRDDLRAKYCELIIGLFIDVGTNYSVLDHTNLSFIYEDVLSPGPNADGEFVKKSIPAVDNWLAPEGIIKDLVTLFPVIRDWITEFLDENKDMTHLEIGKNMLIEQVLRLFHFLVKFGYYSSDDIKLLLKPLLNLLNGKFDKPFPPDNDKGGFSKEAMKIVTQYRLSERYEPNPGTQAIVNAKYQAMDVLDLLLTFQFNTRLESFMAKFKTAELSESNKKGGPKHILVPLLFQDFDAFDTTKKGLGLQKKALRELKQMFDMTAYFDSDQISNMLMDLSNYKYDKMINKALALLNKFYSSKTKLFKMAVQALVLITTDSCHVHREIARTMPILRRYSTAKLNDDQVKTMGAVLDRYASFCIMPKEDNGKHPMNQNILLNHEVLGLMFDILSQEIDAKLMEQYRGLEEIMKKSLHLLASIAKGNDVVQGRMFERLDTLLKIKVVESDLAIALKETFIGNQVTCLKISPNQIQNIVDLAAHHQDKAPEFLDLLNMIVKVEGLGLTLKRNQAYVMKYIMQDYNKLAYVLDQPKEYREKILKGKEGPTHLQYLISLIDLLSTCAEGENRFIESMCQTILSVEELLWVINHHEIDNNLKKPFLRYFLWVYMKTAGSAVESGAGDLPHDGQLWKFMQHVSKDAYEMTTYISRNQESVGDMFKKGPQKTAVADSSKIESVVHVHLYYMFEAVMPILQAFYTKFYVPEKDLYPQEIEHTDKLARALVGFCEVVIPLVLDPGQLKTIISCISAVIPASTVPNSVMEGLIEGIRNSNKLREDKLNSGKGTREYYQGELDLNTKLRTFAVNCSLLYGGHNTVQAQLKCKIKREYTEIGGDEDLPLGEEFQEHLKRFLRPSEKRVTKRIELAKKLVDQLNISHEMYRKMKNDSQRREQEELDIRSLQLLRAIIHNEERKLDEDWEETPQDHKKQIALIRNLQIELNEMGAVINALPHLARPSDNIAKEVLAFVCLMLFNANAEVQNYLLHFFMESTQETFFAAIKAILSQSESSIKERYNIFSPFFDSFEKFIVELSTSVIQGKLLNFFWHSEKESFFAAVRVIMAESAAALKERRSLAAQARARQKEVMAQTKAMQSSMGAGKKALQEIEDLSLIIKRARFGNGRKISLATLQTKAARRVEEKIKNAEHKPKPKPKLPKPKEVKVNGFTTDKMKDNQKLINKEQMEMEEVVIKKASEEKENEQNSMKASMKQEEESMSDELEQKDDGYIELVLRVLARMCDGQHLGLQNYLREQPDNMKSFNIVAETAQFLNLVYSNITNQNIELAIQLFESLNEFAVGNQQNRSVMLNSKVVDYINFILRSGEFVNIPQEKLLDLKHCIGNLLISMTEESSPDSLQIAKEIKDTLDKEAVYKVMGQCFEVQQYFGNNTPPANTVVTESMRDLIGDMPVSDRPKLDTRRMKPKTKGIKGSTKAAKDDQPQSQQQQPLHHHQQAYQQQTSVVGHGVSGIDSKAMEKSNMSKSGSKFQSAKNLAKLGGKMLTGGAMTDDGKKLSPSMRDKLDEVGFVYYLILARLIDIDPRLALTEDDNIDPSTVLSPFGLDDDPTQMKKIPKLNVTPIQTEAFNHYKKNTMSIEIIKDDHLQKVNFRVKNKNVLRDEVKEKMVWNVDRSSPSSKIRDLMKWSKDIIKDIYYQRKILGNPLAKFLTKNWVMWNKMVLLLSIAINVLMLYCWDAPGSLSNVDIASNVTALPFAVREPFWNTLTILISLAINGLMLVYWNAKATMDMFDIPDNATGVPAIIANPWPEIKRMPYYDLILYSLGGAHNFFSFLVLITYFLSNHPSPPNFTKMIDKVRDLFERDKPGKEQEEEEDKEDESTLEVKLFSFTTVFYMIFLGLSIMGTMYQGYFFAFHLLNIVNNNQLLKGVIQAVTQNGRSLVWVGILGFIVFYLYALVSFALLRSSFDPENDMYCNTLWQCTVSVIRYGLIGDIFDKIVSHKAENSFARFGLLVIYHLTFFIFITTIGLNIIFGIIVDTFSELRDLKWTAERDMRDTCFICSRSSYDFEHHGHGFEHHISVEHHIWSYIFFFIHLHDTKHSDYTSLEYYVHKLLLLQRYDFFPLNRALSLSAMDDDSTDSKVDDLLDFVTLLVERQREDDAKKKREEERQKQLRWREEHTSALMGSEDSDTRGGQVIRQKRWQRSIKAAGVLGGLLGAPMDQSGDSHGTTDFMQAMTKDSSQDDYMDTTAISTADDYTLQPPPRGRSPFPSKTPPRSPRSPPPAMQGALQGLLGRLPSRLPSYQETTLDRAPSSEMGGDAVQLIDFEDIADREAEMYEQQQPPPQQMQPQHHHHHQQPHSRRGSSMMPASPTRETFDGMSAAMMSSSRRPSMAPMSQSRDTEGSMSRRPSVAHPSPTPPQRRSPTPSDHYRSRAVTPSDQYRSSHTPPMQDPYRMSHTPTPDPHRASHASSPSDHYRSSRHSSRPSTRPPSRHSPEPGPPPPPLQQMVDPYRQSRSSLPRQDTMLSSHSPREASPYDSLPRSVSKHSIPSGLPKGDSTTDFGVGAPMGVEPMSMSQTSASTGSSRHSDVTRPATDTETEHEPVRGDSADLIDMDQPDDEESFAMGPSSRVPDTTDEDLKSTRV